MKKLIILVIIVVAVGLGSFYWRNLRGVGPAIRPPPADIGRPVDLLLEPNGRLFISDDKAGVIYLVTYHANSTKIKK